MAYNSESDSVFSRLKQNIQNYSAKSNRTGFYFNTDPSQIYSGENLPINEREAEERRKQAGLAEKILSQAFDTPVAISEKMGELTGGLYQGISNSVRFVGEVTSKIPGVLQVSDGLKSLDQNKVLNSLVNGQLPGSRSVTNFINDSESRINKMKSAPWIGKIMALPATVGFETVQLIMPKSWDEIVDGITNKLTRDLLSEVAEILIDWYKDPKTLCCLIKNLAAMGSVVKQGDLSKEAWDQQKQKLFGGVDAEAYLGPDYLNTRNFLIQIRDLLDILIEILSVDLSSVMNSQFDIGKELSDMIIGILISIMEFMIATGKKAWYDKVAEWMRDLNKFVGADSIQCLPVEKLMDALFRFLSSDHGLFNLVENYIRDFSRFLRWKFLISFRKQYTNKIKDLQFLRFVRNLINKILLALENLELCLESDYTIVESNIPDRLKAFGENDNICPYGIGAKTTENWLKCPFRTLDGQIVCAVSDRIPGVAGVISYCINPAAVRDYFAPQLFNQGIGKLKNNYPGAVSGPNIKRKIGDSEEVAVIFPTDNEVRNFLINRMGYNTTLADQIISQAAKSENQPLVDTSLDGTTSVKDDLTGLNKNKNNELINKKIALMSSLGDCAQTLSPQAIANLLTRVSDIL